MTKTKLKIEKREILLILLVGIIFLINIRDIRDLTSPCILFDEIGYWSTGALLTGNDWSSVMTNFTSYYAYGYGIILAFIMLISKTQIMAYRIAIIVNALMICASFLITYYILLKVYKPKNKNVALAVCFATQFYVSIVFNSQIAWTETLLMFLFNIVILSLCRIINKNTVWTNISLAFLIVYLYMVHMRTIGVVICLISFRIILFLVRKEKRRYLLSFFCVLIIMMAIHVSLKQFVSTNNWENFSNISVEVENIKANDYSGQFEKIKYLFSLSGIINFIFLFLGRIYYLGVSTYGIAYEGFFYILAKLKELIKTHKCSKSNIISIFIISSLVLTWCISTLFMIFRGRLDLIIYSRYSDWIVPIIIAIGWLQIIENRCLIKEMKRVLGYVIFLLIYGVIFQNYANLNSGQAFFGSCAPFGYIFFKNGNNVDWIYFMTISSCLIIIIYMVFRYANKKNILMVASSVICLIWLHMSNVTVNAEYANACRDEVKMVSESIKSEDEIYYIIADGVRETQLIGSIQFCVNNVPVQCIPIDMKKTISNGIAIVAKKDQESNLFFSNEELIITSKYYNIYRVN